MKNGAFPVILKENGGRREETAMVPANQKRDARKQWLLAPGDKIRCADQEYTITGEPIGYGGSSVIYPAALSGSCRSYAVKECMPARFGKFCRRGGVICPADPEDEAARQQLRQYREHLDQERIIGQRLSAGTSRVISIWEALKPTAIHHAGEVHTHVSEGIFSLLDRVDQKGMSFRDLLRYISQRPDPESPLKTGTLPRIHTACRMIEQTLLALERVHEAGYLFGDIQDGNVFFTDCRLERSDVGIGSLLDFGSARPLEADGKTAMIQDSVIFTTEGFTPPEILYENNGLLRLGMQADIYGVGCLLLRCVLPAMVIRMRRQTLDEDDGADIGCTGDALKKLNRILSTALADAPESRYPDAPSMLQDIRTLMELVAPPKHELPRNLSAPEYFVPGSRRREIAAVLSALEQGETVFLYGVGGIGKTETAIQAAKQVQSVKGAYLIHYQTSMRHTISLLPFTGTQEEEHQEDWYSRNLRILREEYRGAVLVMDNFDVEGKTFGQLKQEQEYQDLLALDLKLVFTTRYPQKRPEWEVKPLEEGDLLKLMAYHLGGRTLPEESLLSLIREVHGHTLLLTLMAKALSRSHRLTPEALLENLRCGKLEGVAVDSGQMKLSGRQYTQKDIQFHMSALFQMTALTDTQRSVMCCAVLLPQEGMDRVLFEDTLGEDGEALLLSLLDMGWLHARGTLVTIHPVIREVCRTQLQPTGEECSDFLDRLWQRYELEVQTAGPLSWDFDHETIDECYQRAVQVRTAMMQYAECFEHACGLDWKSPGLKTDYLTNAGVLAYNMWEYDKAAALFDTALKLVEAHLGTCWNMLVELNIKLGEAHHAAGNFEIYGGYFLRARQIQQNHPIDEEIHIWLCRNLTAMYLRKEQYTEAVSVCKEWGALCAADPERFFGESLTQKLKLSEIYEDMLQERKAWKIMRQVLRTVEARPDCMDNQSKAMLLTDCGDYLRISASGSLTKARECYLSAINIYRGYLDPDDSIFMGLYFDVALCCRMMGRYEEAVDYAHMTEKLCEAYLPAGRRHQQTSDILGDSCYMIARKYFRRGDYTRALSYAQEAYTHRQDAENRYRRLSARQLAAIHSCLGDRETALEYEREAFRLGWPAALMLSMRDPDAGKPWQRVMESLSEFRLHILFGVNYLAKVIRFWKDDRKQ